VSTGLASRESRGCASDHETSVTTAPGDGDDGQNSGAVRIRRARPEARVSHGETEAKERRIPRGGPIRAGAEDGIDAQARNRKAGRAQPVCGRQTRSASMATPSQWQRGYTWRERHLTDAGGHQAGARTDQTTRLSLASASAAMRVRRASPPESNHDDAEHDRDTREQPTNCAPTKEEIMRRRGYLCTDLASARLRFDHDKTRACATLSALARYPTARCTSPTYSTYG
jgi:hypothetical protein